MKIFIFSSFGFNQIGITQIEISLVFIFHFDGLVIICFLLKFVVLWTFVMSSCQIKIPKTKSLSVFKWRLSISFKRMTVLPTCNTSFLQMSTQTLDSNCTLFRNVPLVLFKSQTWTFGTDSFMLIEILACLMLTVVSRSREKSANWSMNQLSSEWILFFSPRPIRKVSLSIYNLIFLYLPSYGPLMT